MTASPDWPAVRVYSTNRWDSVRTQLEALPNIDPDVRKLQRRMLGNAHWSEGGEPLLISAPLAEFSEMGRENASVWLICFDQDTAELWTEHQLLSLSNINQLDESVLVQFIRGDGQDHRGRTLDDVLALDNFWLEHTHDYIQWLFPLPEPSRANFMAPILTDEDRAAFQGDDNLKLQHRRALDRMLGFFGLVRRNLEIKALPGLNLKDHIWLKSGGHNHLRITRIIRSLHCCDQPELARAVQVAFVTIGQSHGLVGEVSVSYWLRAGS